MESVWESKVVNVWGGRGWGVCSESALEGGRQDGAHGWRVQARLFLEIDAADFRVGRTGVGRRWAIF